MAVTQADLDDLMLLGEQFTDAILALAPNNPRVLLIVRGIRGLSTLVYMYLRQQLPPDPTVPPAPAIVGSGPDEVQQDLRDLLAELERDGAAPTTP